VVVSKAFGDRFKAVVLYIADAGGDTFNDAYVDIDVAALHD
jgi:hypothetical protein